MGNNLKKTFIFLSRQNDWGFFKRRNECLLWELSKRDSVESLLHIESITIKGLISLFLRWWKEKDPHIKETLTLHIKKAISPNPISVTKGGNVYVSSIFVFPYKGTVRAKLSQLFLKIQFTMINKRFIQSKKDIVAIAYPPSYYLPMAIEILKYDVLIADLVDDVIERAKDAVSKDAYIGNYKAILPKCKWIFSTSPLFRDKYKMYAAEKEIEFLSNGVDCYEFPAETSKKFFKNHNRKTVGYIGNILEPADLDLLEYAISHYPQVDFVLIGPANKDKSRHLHKLIHQYTNCYYLGERRFTEIPGYISSFDVLTNIKKADHRTCGNDSMKIYQYLLSGKPIVSTPAPPADRFADLMYIASDKLQFAQYLKLALEENNQDIRQKRIQAALENTWSKKVDIILSRISDPVR